MDFNLISLIDMFSASFNMHNCDAKIQLLLPKPYRSKWEGRTLTPPLIFLTLKWEGRAVQKGGSDPPLSPNPTLTARLGKLYTRIKRMDYLPENAPTFPSLVG